MIVRDQSPVWGRTEQFVPSFDRSLIVDPVVRLGPIPGVLVSRVFRVLRKSTVLLTVVRALLFSPFRIIFILVHTIRQPSPDAWNCLPRDFEILARPSGFLG